MVAFSVHLPVTIEGVDEVGVGHLVVWKVYRGVCHVEWVGPMWALQDALTDLWFLALGPLPDPRSACICFSGCRRELFLFCCFDFDFELCPFLSVIAFL